MKVGPKPAPALAEHPLRLARPDRRLDRAGHPRSGAEARFARPSARPYARASRQGCDVHRTNRCHVRIACAAWPELPATAGADRARHPQMGLRALAADQPRALRQAADDRRPDALPRDPGDAHPRPLVGQRRLLRRPQRRGGPRAGAPTRRRSPTASAPIPMAEVRAVDVPGPGGPMPSRLYVPPPADRPRSRRRCCLLPRRRLGDRRPRHLRRRLPDPRRGGRRAGALGRLPARPRAPLPGAAIEDAYRRVRVDGRERRRRSAPTRRGSRVGGDSAGGNMADRGQPHGPRRRRRHARRCSC